MQDFLRFFVAAIFSALIWVGTMAWYRSNSMVAQSMDETPPVASVSRIDSDVKRRPTDRQVWFPVSMGDELRVGETIRTASASSAHLVFTQSQRSVEIEPDSLLVIQETGAGLEIDLKKGGVYVAPPTSGSSSLTLRSQSQVVDLSRAAASVDAQSAGHINVEVLQGEASAQVGGKEKKFVGTAEVSATGVSQNLSPLVVLSPTATTPVQVNPEAREEVTFRWAQAPANSEVELFVGARRDQLKSVGKIKNSEKAEFRHRLAPGRYFWQLQTTSLTTTLKTPIRRLEVQASYPPIALYPEELARLPVGNQPTPVEFQWQNAAHTPNTFFELATDSAVQSRLVAKTFRSEEKFTQNLGPGTYYWRVTALDPQTQKAAVGSLHTFSVGDAKPTAALPVEKKAPPFSWVSPRQDVELTSRKLRLEWALSGTEKRKFRIQIDSLADEKRGPAAAPITSETAQTFWVHRFRPGNYRVSVQAVNEKNEVFASLEPRTLKVQPLPKPDSPKILPESGDLEATDEGTLQLRWTASSGAAGYKVWLEDSTGEKKEISATRNQSELLNLKPGDYTVHVQAKNEDEVWSEPSEIRKIVVPDPTGLDAPVLKGVKVQ